MNHSILQQMLNEALLKENLNESASDELPNYFNILPKNLVSMIKMNYKYNEKQGIQNIDELNNIIEQIKEYKRKTNFIPPELTKALNDLDTTYNKWYLITKDFSDEFEEHCNLCLLFVQIMNAIRGDRLALEFIHSKDNEFYISTVTKKHTLNFTNKNMETTSGFNEFMNKANAYAQKSGLFINHPRKTIIEFGIK